MKAYLVALAILLTMFSAATLLAANSVNITGNLKMDGYLTIDVDWTVDTAKYRNKEAISQSVHDDIWAAVLPKLVKNTGDPAKCTQSNFTKISDSKKLLKQRPDGSKIYDYRVTLKFECNTGIVKKRGTPTSPEMFTEGFHDGFTNEANAF